MILAQRASLLGELGKLRKSLALTEEQFKRVKALILKDDPSVTMDLLSTLGTFWEQRAEGILTDNEYNDQVVEAFGYMHSGDAHAVAVCPEPLVPSHHSSSKRKRSEPPLQTQGSEDAVIGGARLSNGGGASGSGGSSAAHYNARDIISVCGSDDAGPDSDMTAPQSEPYAGHDDDDSRTESDSGCHGGVSDSDSERGVGNGGGGGGSGIGGITARKNSVEMDCNSDGTEDEDDIWTFIRSHRWLVTEDFKIPGKSFCHDASLICIVDSTVDLLERSHVKQFPKIMRGHIFGMDNTQRLHRQKKMYVLLKKVMICKGPNGEQRVFRATPAEIVDGLENLWGKELDKGFRVDDYYDEIIRKRS